MSWPYSFAALQTAQGSYLDSNFADAAQLGTAVNFSGIGGTTPGTGAFTTLSATGEITAGASGTGLSVTNDASVGGALTVTGAIGCTGGYAAPGGTVGLTLDSFGDAVLPNSAAVGTTASTGNVLFATGGSATNYLSVFRQMSSTGGGIIAFENLDATIAGSITLGSALASVAFNTTSDAALKTLHGPADGTPLSVLPVRDAAFTAAPTARRPMLIAQEVAAVCPWAVTEGDGTPAHPSMIDHGALVPAVLAYVQSIDARLAAIESAVTALHASLPATVGPSLTPVIAALAPAATGAAVAAKAALAEVLALPVMQAAIARGNAAATGGTSGQAVQPSTP